MTVAPTRACMVIVMAASFLPLVHPDTAGAASLPPQNPPANVVPPPGYSRAVRRRRPTQSVLPGGSRHDRRRPPGRGRQPDEPADELSSLTPQQQIYVVTNLERVDRGLAPAPGPRHAVRRTGAAGAATGGDPSFPPYANGGGATYSSTSSIFESDDPVDVPGRVGGRELGVHRTGCTAVLGPTATSCSAATPRHS